MRQVVGVKLQKMSGVQNIGFNEGAKILGVTYHFGEITLWALQDTTKRFDNNRNIRVMAEYDSVGDDFLIYLGSCVSLEGTETWHIFEDKGFS